MGKKRSYQFGIGILLSGVILLASVLTAVAVVKPEAPVDAPRADMILIDGMKAFQPLERPAVPFYHDKHTEALAKQGKDCLACHEKVDDKLSLKFKRSEDTSRQAVMDIYHDQCISCHKESAKPGAQSGPVTCGACHLKDGASHSNRQPIGLDKSLHYRHVKANDKKCETCHHAYNEKEKKLYYAKGEEGACLYCHGEKKEENRISNRAASHQSCVSCHLNLAAGNKDAGPVQCEGCHDPRQQAIMEKLADVPRMERNQPSQVLVKAAASPEKAALLTNRMSSVPFDHKSHEGYNDNCRACHHASLTSCAECHTIPGSDKGKQVSLAQAMHQKDAQSSCVGCHNQQQAKPECAGCHASIPKGKALAAESACQTCHISSDYLEDPDAAGDMERQAMAAQLLASRQAVTQTVSIDQIPENVTIKALADQYEEAVMPHRQIVLKLAEAVKGNRLAEYFHTDAATLCQGCHHNSPASVKPPQCASCHGRTSEALNLTRPGLLAAYHQQCIQCHDEMGLEKPASRDCTACHAKRK